MLIETKQSRPTLPLTAFAPFPEFPKNNSGKIVSIIKRTVSVFPRSQRTPTLFFLFFLILSPPFFYSHDGAGMVTTPTMTTGLAIIPEISITLAGDSTSNLLTLPESPVFVTTTIVQHTRLVVPPRPWDGPSRRTLAQRGLRLGSFRLNCTESVSISHPQTPFSSSSPRTANDILSTRRMFHWTRSSLSAGASTPGTVAVTPTGAGAGLPGGNIAGGNRVTRPQSHRGHSRARSLNSLAELNETLKMNVTIQQPNKHYHPYESKRTPSIDLSILGFSPSSNPSHQFASAL